MLAISCGVAVGPPISCGGVAGGEVEDQESENGDAEQDRNRFQQAPQAIDQHNSASPVSQAMARGRQRIHARYCIVALAIDQSPVGSRVMPDTLVRWAIVATPS